MLELSAGEIGGTLRLGFGGDSLNTAVYLARLGVPVEYVSALGDDPYSDRLVQSWQDEGIDTRSVLRIAGRLPGLYAIETDPLGERRFFFWRGESAARHFFDHAEGSAGLRALESAQLLYFSLISLSILPPADRNRFVELAQRCHSRGGRVAFDSNFRAQAWPDPSVPRTLIEHLAPCVQYALPTLEDEAQIFGTSSAERCAERWLAMGAREVAVKCGVRGAWVQSRDGEGCWVAPESAISKPVDTTAAGDSFNAGYLAARLSNAPPIDAAACGNALAAVVIQHRGAIVPRSAFPRVATP